MVIQILDVPAVAESRIKKDSNALWAEKGLFCFFSLIKQITEKKLIWFSNIKLSKKYLQCFLREFFNNIPILA